MGWCTAQCKMLLCCVKTTIVKESHSFELAGPSEKEERISVLWWLSGLVLLQGFFMPVGMLFVMNTFEDEWYVVIKAHKFMVFEIFERFFVLSYILRVCTIPTFRVYQLYNEWAFVFWTQRVLHSCDTILLTLEFHIFALWPLVIQDLQKATINFCNYQSWSQL